MSAQPRAPQVWASPAAPATWLGWVLLAALLAVVLGASWDIQWHYAIGRDRPFIPPHLLLLAGITLSGLAALTSILFHSLAVRGGGAPAAVNLRLFGVFYAPLGAYLAGFGALCAALAFPLDDYWHHVYGLDVTIWAPFHVMIVGGMALVALGAAYLFMGGLITVRHPGRYAMPVGLVLSLTLGVAVVLLLQAQALDKEGIIVASPLTGRTGAVFPILLAALVVPWLVTAAVALPFPGGATAVALALTLLRLGLFAFVPAALRWAAALEGARIRETAMNVIATPTAFPLWSVVAALLVDGAWWAVRRSHAKRGGTRVFAHPVIALTIAGAGAGIALAVLDRPWQRTLPSVAGGRAMNVHLALLDALPLVVLTGVLAAIYGLGLGGALRSFAVRRVSAGTRGVVYGLASALGVAMFWSLILAAQGSIGPSHPPLLPLPWTQIAVPNWLGWAMGLLPGWGVLALVLVEGLATRGLQVASALDSTGTSVRLAPSPASPEQPQLQARSDDHHRLDKDRLRLVRRSCGPAA